MTQSLGNQAKLLLFIFTCFSFASLLSGTFVPVYLWKQSESYLHIGLYILGQYLSGGIMFYALAGLAKQGKKRLLIQLGCSVIALFYALILFCGQQAKHYVFTLGSLYGVGLAFFWLAYNILYFEITEANNRDRFNGWQGIFVALCSIAAPFIASRLIVLLGDDSGYRFIFMSSLVLYIVIIVSSIKLVQRAKEGAFHWLFPIKAFVTNNPDWKHLGLAIIAQGVKEGMFLSLLPFIVFVTTSSEAEVGLYTLVSALVALVANYIVGKILQPSKRQYALYSGAIGSWFAVTCIIISPNLTGLLLFGAFTALLWPLFVIPFTSIVFDSIAQSEQSVKLKVEIIVFRELALMIGRLTGLIPFFVYSIWLFKIQLPVGWLLLLVALFPIVSAYFIKKMQRNNKSI